MARVRDALATRGGGPPTFTVRGPPRAPGGHHAGGRRVRYACVATRAQRARDSLMRENRAPFGVLNVWINITPLTPVCRLARLMQTYTIKREHAAATHTPAAHSSSTRDPPSRDRVRADDLAPPNLRGQHELYSNAAAQGSREPGARRHAPLAKPLSWSEAVEPLISATARHGPRSALGNQLVGALAARFPSFLCAPTVQRSGRRRVRTPGCWARGADASRGSELTRRSSVGWLPASQHRGSAPLVAVFARLSPLVGVCAQSANNALEHYNCMRERIYTGLLPQEASRLWIKIVLERKRFRRKNFWQS